MNTTDKVMLALAAIAFGAIVLYHRSGHSIALSPLGAGKGPAPFANVPAPTVQEALAQQNVAPWGTVPPLTPMIRRSSGIMGIPDMVAPGCAGCGN